MQGIKHLVECHCVLPQFRNSPKPVYHRFVVFSIIDDSNTIVPKHAQCNNCGVIHNVVDICKSEIYHGKEVGAIMEKKDISLMLPDSIINILESYDCDIATWENALFILQNTQWGEHIVLTRNEEESEIHGKILKFYGAGQYRIEPYMIRNRI